MKKHTQKQQPPKVRPAPEELPVVKAPPDIEPIVPHNAKAVEPAPVPARKPWWKRMI